MGPGNAGATTQVNRSAGVTLSRRDWKWFTALARRWARSVGVRRGSASAKVGVVVRREFDDQLEPGELGELCLAHSGALARLPEPAHYRSC